MNKNYIQVLAFSLTSTFALGQDKTYVAPDVNIISVSPVQGSGLDIDRVPGKIQTINRDQIGKKKNLKVSLITINKF